MKPFAPIGRLICVLVFGATLVAGEALAQGAGNQRLPWPADSRVTIDAAEEDIKEVLRTILRTGNMAATFKGDVGGNIDILEEDVPPQAVFDRLINEYQLSYSYNAANRLVTIQPRLARAQGPTIIRRFVTPQFVSFEVVRSVLTNFGLGTDGVTFESRTGTISIQTTDARAADIISLIKELDEATGEKRLAELAAERADFERKVYRDLRNTEVKVIALRFASVGSTEKRFQGQSISVPGIEETLQAILGIPVQGAQSQLPEQETGVSVLNVGGSRRGSGGAQSLELQQAAALQRLRNLARPTISIDQRTNSVIVRGSPEAIAEVETIIRQLDQPLKMIEIEVVVMTASRGVTEELGVRLRGAVFNRGTTSTGTASTAFDSGTTGTQATNATTGVSALTLLPVAAANSFLGSFIVTGSDGLLSAQINALSDDNLAQVVASPRVITLDNVNARITRSRNIYVQIPASGDAGQDLQEIDTGLSIDLLPSIVPSDVAGAERLIRMTLNATNSAPGSGAFGQIDVESQEIQTDVLVPDGGTYVIGGLFDDTRTEGDSGVPGLKDIPILGGLFSSKSSADQLSETIFLITPRIVDEAQVLQRDIATRVGTVDYIKRQRRSLDRLSGQVQSGQRPFPNSVRYLREDE
jgi:type II secretory pathway component GspD/PulD (secretin)